MNASTRWQETIADNLSASQIPGFKKQDLSFSAVQAGFLPRVHGASPGTTQRVTMPLAGVSTNYQPGELRPTGITTDLAIEGPGFFEVQMPDGTHGYTRDGEFHLNAQGQLTSKQGLLVMGDGGPVQLDANNAAPATVAPTGEISQGGVIKGKLKLTQFSDAGALAPAGASLFVVADPTAQPQPATSASVRQGFLEQANTSAMLEMGNLITAMRLYEANQKVFQTQDDRMSRLINDVANPT